MEDQSAAIIPSAEQFAQAMPVGPYLAQHCKGGPWMPARLLVGEAGWQVESCGQRFEPHPDPCLAERAMWLFRWGRPCSELEFAFAAARVEYARQHDPESPYAHPERPYDPRTAPVLF